MIKKDYTKNTIWVNKPKRYYIIYTDQKKFEYKTYSRFNYSETIKEFKRKGYTNVRIAFIGFIYDDDPNPSGNSSTSDNQGGEK